MSASQIESASKWLLKLAVEEVQYLAEVRDKVEELQSELEWMQCFLWDANEKQKNNATIQKWVSDIRELALRAEDVIETYILQVSHKRKNSNIKWIFSCLMDAPTLHHVGSDIDSLTSRLSKLSSRLQIYGVTISNDGTTKQQLASEKRQEYCHTQEDVIGLDQRLRDVENMLALGSEKVVLVYGMGGVGKTTLARSLYQDPCMKNHFDCLVWAYVSQNLQIGAVFRDILLQLIPEHEEGERKIVAELQDSQLPGKVYDMLKTLKCLVILDDVWFSRDWNRLLPAFPLNDGNCGCKLLVTTRNRKIASGHGDYLLSYYEAELLDEDKSWELFERKAHFIKNDNKGTLKLELASKMLNHCKGHPLAIVVLGGILVTKKTDEEWQSVYDNLSSHLEGDEFYRGVYDVLALSYYELSYNLKACFLHLAYFPEDFEIPADKVYHLWIAEGVVSSAQDQLKISLEDIAKDYLHELVQKGMVQVGRMKDYEEKIHSCRLHDLMRDMCQKMAKEENLLQIFDRQARVHNDEPQPQVAPNCVLNHKIRRVGIYVGGHGHDDIHKSLSNSSSGEVPPLRSVLFFPTDEVREESCEWMKSVSKDFHLLRILDCSELPLKGSLPRKVGNLVYLRYLSLSGTHVTKLPSSIGNLRSLLVLDLRVSGVIIKVPNVLWKLKSLRQLYFPTRPFSQEAHARHQGYEIQGGEVLSLDNLIYLETLEELDLDTVNVSGLVRLTSMTYLVAICKSKKESLELILKSSNIKSLSLRISAHMLVEDPMMLSHCHYLKYFHIESGKYENFNLPITLEMFPQNLVELGFWYCQLHQDPMMVLANLPFLKNLELHYCYRSHTLHCPPNGFPELVHLAFDGLSSLRKWTAEKDSCPKLKRGNVQNPNSPFESFPDVIQP